jgi:hypothetical protein
VRRAEVEPLVRRLHLRAARDGAPAGTEGDRQPRQLERELPEVLALPHGGVRARGQRDQALHVAGGEPWKGNGG